MAYRTFLFFCLVFFFCLSALSPTGATEARAFTVKNTTRGPLVGSVRTEQDDVVIFQFRLNPGEKGHYKGILDGAGYTVHVREERPSSEKQAVGEVRVQTTEAYVEISRSKGRLVIDVDDFTEGEKGVEERHPGTQVFPLPEVRPPMPE